MNNTIVAETSRAAPAAKAGDIFLFGGGTVDAASSYNLLGTGGSGGLVNNLNHNRVGVANAGLEPLQDNGGPTKTMALQRGSPAIDAGSNTALLAAHLVSDQRGLPRIVNGTVDIGAFERQTGAVPMLVKPFKAGSPAIAGVGAPKANSIVVKLARIRLNGLGDRSAAQENRRRRRANGGGERQREEAG